MNNLKHYRIKNNLTIGKISEILDLDRDTYSKYEIDYEPMKTRTIIKLCNLYEITPNELLGFKTDSLFNEDEVIIIKKTIEILRKKI